MPTALQRRITKKLEVRSIQRAAHSSSYSHEKAFRYQVRREMEEMGATQEEMKLIHDSMIKSALQNKRTPRDVAWAIMQ